MEGDSDTQLSAIGAPTRPLWVPLGIAYTLLVTAFGWGVWAWARRKRPLRVVGGLMIASGVIGLAWPPMHQRAVLAAGGGTLTDTMHLVWSAVTVLLFMLEISISLPLRLYRRHRITDSRILARAFRSYVDE